MSSTQNEARKQAGARPVAIQVLYRVMQEGAYASAALDAELTRAKLDARDAALATEIVYGTLRVLPTLDRAIAALVTQDPARMEAFTRAALRSAAYQIAHLGRIPAHAIVDETVTFVRNKRGPRMGGFANALLRKLVSQRPADPQRPDKLVVPAWFAKLLLSSLGETRAAAVLAEHALPPPLCLRVEPERIAREALAERVSAAFVDAQVELSPLSPLSLLTRRVGSPRTLPGYDEGLFSVQEEGAQLLALVLDAQPGERIADVCAGHGGKTTLFARQVGASGHVTAIDLDERKLERIPAELARLGLPADRVDLQAIDVSVGTGGLAAAYDRVLVDAPCTGAGTVDRRPELLLRLQPGDPARLAELQLRILKQAVKLVRPGGLLAYAVCSPMRAEGLDVALQLEAAEPSLRRLLAAERAGLPALDADGFLRVGPWLGTPGSLCRPDAYQLVAWRLPT